MNHDQPTRDARRGSPYLGGLTLVVFLLLSGLNTWAGPPDYSPIVAGVSQVTTTGGPGPVVGIEGPWETLVSGDDDGGVLSSVVVIRGAGSGFVVGIGHEGLLVNTAELDNGTLLSNLFAFLSGGPPAVIAYTTGHSEFVTGGGLAGLQAILEGEGYTFIAVSAPVSAASLTGIDGLIVGNAWGQFTPGEISDIESWVQAGGGLVLAGLGWSWPGEQPDYPMVELAEPYGLRWYINFISDPTDQHNGSPIFSNFYPQAEHLNVAQSMQTIIDALAAHPADLSTELESDAGLQHSFGLAHLVLGQLPIVVAEGEPMRQALYDFHLDRMNDPSGFSYYRKSRTYPEPEQTIAWLRERFYRTWLEAVPLDSTVIGEVLSVSDFPAAYSDLMNDYGLYVQDNTEGTAAQLGVIRGQLDAIPSSLHTHAFLSMRDYLGPSPPGGMKLSAWGAGKKFASNTFAVDVGEITENQFPLDVPVENADLFYSALAHEFNHIVDAVTVEGDPAGYLARRNALIAAAGPTQLNYLRSMIPEGFFVSNPQEFFASIANQWLNDSLKVMELATVRLAGGISHPYDQAVFFADVYSLGGLTTLFYKADLEGNISVSTAVLQRNGNGHITQIAVGVDVFVLTVDPEGNVLSAERQSGVLVDSGFE